MSDETLEYPEVQFVIGIVRQLLGLDEQDFLAGHDFTVKRTMDEKGVLIDMRLPREHLGGVIGKGGATANAIRDLLRQLGSRRNARYALKFDTM